MAPIYPLFLFLFIFISSSLANVPINNSVEFLNFESLEQTTNLHSILEAHLRKEKITELFVRNLLIDGINHGPVYHNLDHLKYEKLNEEDEEGERIHWHITAYLVSKLDFGRIEKYSGLRKEDKSKVEEMKQKLVRGDIFFRNNITFRVKEVIVNGINYGEHPPNPLESLEPEISQETELNAEDSS
jgi:hypothetical protein